MGAPSVAAATRLLLGQTGENQHLMERFHPLSVRMGVACLVKFMASVLGQKNRQVEGLSRGRVTAIIVPLVLEVPQAILKRRPKPAEWSAHEHACHLAAVHPLMVARRDLMLTNANPRIRPYLPHLDDDDGALLRVDLAEAMERFKGDRQRLVQRLKKLSDEDRRRRKDHSEYTHYSVFIMFRHLAMHDMFHAYRIEELLLKNDWE